MENNLLVSVVIPTYNRSKFICRAIDSVCKQTYKNVEIIIVDDGSTDNTKAVLKPHMDNIKYLYQQNWGVEAARNAGINASSGRWIAFLDSDDYWHPKKIQTQIDCLLEEKLQVCFTKIKYSFEEDVPEDTKGYALYDMMEYLKSHTLYVQTMLIEKDLIRKVGKFDENLKVGGDTLMNFKIALKVSIFSLINYKATTIERGECRNGLMTEGLSLARRRAVEGPYIFFNLYSLCDLNNKDLLQWIRRVLGNYLYLKAKILLADNYIWAARRSAIDSIFFGQNIKTSLKCFIIIFFPFVVKKKLSNKYSQK